MVFVESRIGNSFPAVSFTIEVPSAGDYAVNLSHLTALKSRLFVRVNDNPETILKLKPTGNWCFKEGLSSVLSLELQLLIKGSNKITCSADKNHVVLIESISVVIRDG